MVNKKRSSNKISKRKIGLIILLSLIFVCFISSYFIYTSNLTPVSTTSEFVVFDVVEGDTLDSITVRLEEDGIIQSATFAKLDAKINNVEGFIVGKFLIDISWTPSEILAYFTLQENVESNSVMVTFVEGIWAKDVAKKISLYYDYSAQDFIDLWNDDTFLSTLISKYEFLDESILNSEYPVKLEGYLFPETYMFDYDMSMEEVTYVFLDYFNTVYNEFASQISESQFTLHEWVILASIVQYESATTLDMQNIAQVFLNRLEIGMMLQSSVTVCYALYEFDSWEECESEYNYESPYNTYLNYGLPIGPILNPGYEALNAVLNPMDNDYLFFIADVYGDGTVYYSYTYEEHLEKQNQYLGY